MLCFEFSSIFNLFSPWRDNNSYGYYSKVSDSAGKLTFNYGDVFDEYTNADANISCSGKKTCYVGCTCKSGWNGKKTISSSGSNLTTSGAGADLSGSYTIADSGSAPKTTASTSGLNISTMATGDSCTISVTDPRYSVTCTKASTYDCAGVCGGSAYFKCTSGSTSSSCSSGYYSVNVGKQKCTSGSATNSTSCYTCSQCTYTCPTSGYSINTTSCGSGYTLKTESATKVNSSCPAKTCGKCESSKPIYYKVRVILLPENAVMNTNGQYSVGFPDGSKYTSSSQFGSIALGLSCYNDVYSSGTTPLFDTVTIAGDISYINRNGTRTDDSFKYEMNCNWPRTSLDGGAGLNAIYPIIAPTADTDRVAVQYSNLELNIPGVGWEDDAASFEYNGKRYWIQFDVTVETGRVVVGQAGPSSQRYNCPGKGESDTSWPNCD